MLRHGYQSWSPTGVATFGVDQDPTRSTGVRSLPIGMHHADWAHAEDGELRSELVTALRDDDGRRARRRVPRRMGARRHLPGAAGRDGSDGVELWIEAFLGGAVLAARRAPRAARGVAGRRRRRPVAAARGVGRPRSGAAGRGPDDGAVPGGLVLLVPLLRTASPRPTCGPTSPAPPTGPSTSSSSTTASRPPSATGSPPTTSSRRALDGARRRHRGRRPHARASGSRRSSPAPSSAVARRAPRLARRPPRRAARRWSAWCNEAWGGAVHTLDTTQPGGARPPRGASPRRSSTPGYPLPEARLHLRPVDPRRLRRPQPHAGPAGAGRLRRHPARRGRRRVPPRLRRAARAGGRRGRRDAHRRRRRPVVAPAGRPVPAARATRGGEPATVNAWRNTLSRSFLHRRLWLNDPDCLMLRTERTRLEPEQMRAWALAVGRQRRDGAGVRRPGPARRRRARACSTRSSPSGARPTPAPHPPRCPDLLDADPPDAPRHRRRWSSSAIPTPGVAHVQACWPRAASGGGADDAVGRLAAQREDPAARPRRAVPRRGALAHGVDEAGVQQRRPGRPG